MKKKKTISRLLVLTLSILLVMSISAVTAFAGEEQESVQDQTLQPALLAGGSQITTRDELQAALDAGGTVTLMQDISGDTLYINNKVTLDLNGQILRCRIEINSTGSLTLKDSDPDVVHDTLTYHDPFDQTVYKVAGGAVAGNTLDVKRGGKLFMEAGTITGASGALVVNGSFVMTGGTIAGNGKGDAFKDDYDEWDGGSVSIVGKGTFKMQGGRITCNVEKTKSNGEYSMFGSVCVANGGTFTMEGGSITRNASRRGGGVCAYSGGTFTMLDGEISGNKAPYGGGVYVWGGTFDMQGGVIANNTAIYQGGGVGTGGRLRWSASLINSAGPLDDPLIPPDNSADIQITIPIEQSFYMSGGSITGNRVEDDTGAKGSGGGISLGVCTHFEMSGDASVTDNIAGQKGGGIFVDKDRLLLDLGESSFGEVELNVSQEIKLAGGSISGNTAGETGGGIFMPCFFNEPIRSSTDDRVLYPPVSTLELSGKMVVCENTSGNDGARIKNNLYLCEDAYLPITGDLTGSIIGVTTEAEPTEEEPVVFTRGLSGRGTAANFFSDDMICWVKLNTDKEAYVGIAKCDITIGDHTNGSLSAFVDGSPDSAGIRPGTLVTVEATPDQGYELDKLAYIMDDGTEKEITAGEDGTYRFSVPQSNVTVTAVFSLPAVKPEITEQPQDLSLTYGDKEGSILCAAEDIEGHTLSYQWYSNTAKSNEGGKKIEGATDAAFAVPAGLSKGDYYFYCVVTATRTSNNKSKTTVSDAARITVNTRKITPKVTLSGTSYPYNGKVKTPGVTVKDGTTVLKKNTDYTVTYAAGRKNIGTYKVTVTLKGNYSGTKAASFRIVPKGTSLVSLTPGTKKMTVKWKKQTIQTTGYQIQYSRSSAFAAGNKTVKVAKRKSVSKVIKGLKTGKKYYVRIRTYKTVKGKTYYSGWSKKKPVTVK